MTEVVPKAKRAHKATYATDKRKGGYLVRVIGPHAGEFVGREIPVTRRDDTESLEKLVKLVWSGKDEGTKDNPGTGQPAALYTFAAKPRVEDEIRF
jgi:hypothetical protein